MPQQKHASTERKTNRLEAFSDAVLAIAITLPVVSLESPTIKAGDDLAKAYAALWPGYLSYALSCLVIGLYWAHSHFSGKILRETDHGFNLLTILFLALVSITPFPARPFVEHWSDPANCRIAATVYAGVLTAPTLIWYLRWTYALKHDLLDPRLAPSYLYTLTIKYGLTVVADVTATLICWFADWRVGMGVMALVIFGYALPPMTPEYNPGQEPKDELEEPDEVEMAPSQNENARG